MKYFHVFLLIFFSATAAAQGRTEQREIVVDGLNRSFVVYVPATGSTPQSLPVLISLHGRFGTGEQMLTMRSPTPDGCYSKSWGNGPR